MFSLIFITLILLTFASLAMALEQAGERKAFALHMMDAGTPVQACHRAQNEVLCASLLRVVSSPEHRARAASKRFHRTVCGL